MKEEPDEAAAKDTSLSSIMKSEDSDLPPEEEIGLAGGPMRPRILDLAVGNPHGEKWKSMTSKPKEQQ